MFEYFDIDLTKASFEWDEEKDRINFMKHGIHFRTAVKVFLDPKKMIREDEEHPEELRYDILGTGWENPFCCLCISGPECNQDDFRTAGNNVGEREV